MEGLAEVPYEQLVEQDYVWVGTPSDIVERIEQTLGVCEGIKEIAITVNAGGAPHWMAIKNQELFAQQVIPPFRVGSRASAKYAYTSNAADASISASSLVEYSGLAHATGVETSGVYYAHDVNAGDISAYALSHDGAAYGYFSYGAASATGVREVANYFGGVVMENSGSITATAIPRDVAGLFFGGAAATGVYQDGKYYAGLDNSGDIHAQAYSELGIVSAYGVVSRSKYGSYTVVENHEGASIVSVAETGSAADDTYGGRAFSHGINMFGGSFAQVYNDGDITASARVDNNDRDYFDNPALAYAYGVEQRGTYGERKSGV